MTKPIARDPIYRKRLFDADIIVLCVRWYISYRLTYRDLVEILAERSARRAFNDSSLCGSVRARREALGQVSSARRWIVAVRRDVRVRSRAVALLV